MKILTMVFSILLVPAFSQANDGNPCPMEAGETAACEFETMEVQSALEGLEKGEEYVYCKIGTSLVNEINCRKIVQYKDKDGQYTDSVFEDWLIYMSPETEKEAKKLNTVRTYFVKQQNGNYTMYTDLDPTLTPQVDKITMDDKGQPLQDDVKITFNKDQDNLPSFSTDGFNFSTKKVETVNISYDSADAFVQVLDVMDPDTGLPRLDIYNRIQGKSFN